MVGDSETMVAKFLAALKARGDIQCQEPEVAVLSEAATTYGGIFRRTTKNLADVSHIEQRFTVKFERTLSNASNNNNETLEQSVERIKTVLENKGFEELLIEISEREMPSAIFENWKIGYSSGQSTPRPR